eukprot:1160605-Pelagomonas_calceolata.AAC.5
MDSLGSLHQLRMQILCPRKHRKRKEKVYTSQKAACIKERIQSVKGVGISAEFKSNKVNALVLRRSLRRIKVGRSVWDKEHKDSVRATLVPGRGDRTINPKTVKCSSGGIHTNEGRQRSPRSLRLSCLVICDAKTERHNHHDVAKVKYCEDTRPFAQLEASQRQGQQRKQQQQQQQQKQQKQQQQQQQQQKQQRQCDTCKQLQGAEITVHTILLGVVRTINTNPHP